MQDAPLYYSMEKIWVQSLAGFCLVNIFPFLSMCWSKCEKQVWKHWQHIFKYIVFCFVKKYSKMKNVQFGCSQSICEADRNLLILLLHNIIYEENFTMKQRI